MCEKHSSPSAKQVLPKHIFMHWGSDTLKQEVTPATSAQDGRNSISWQAENQPYGHINVVSEVGAHLIIGVTSQFIGR